MEHDGGDMFEGFIELEAANDNIDSSLDLDEGVPYEREVVKLSNHDVYQVKNSFVEMDSVNRIDNKESAICLASETDLKPTHGIDIYNDLRKLRFDSEEMFGLGKSSAIVFASLSKEGKAEFLENGPLVWHYVDRCSQDDWADKVMGSVSTALNRLPFNTAAPSMTLDEVYNISKELGDTCNSVLVRGEHIHPNDLHMLEVARMADRNFSNQQDPKGVQMRSFLRYALTNIHVAGSAE